MKSLSCSRIFFSLVLAVISYTSVNSHAQTGQICNWYGSSIPVCANQTTGWGWESSATCIGATECTNAGQTISGSSGSSSSGGGNSDCASTTITPFINANGAWAQSTSATINAGASVTFGPHPTSGGSWSWSGCGTSGSSREQSVSPSASCTATATYTNSCGSQSTQAFNITVNGSSSGGGNTDDGSTGGGNANCGLLGSELAWGTNGDANAASYLDFITTWVGYEYVQDRAYQCDGCGMVSQLASSSTYVAYYAYFAGFALPDCNVQPEGGNLCTNGAEWIRNNYDYLISLYADYAAQTYAADPNKGVLWLLEGDFHQFSIADQSQPLSMQELGQLAADITQAIKSNAPNAKVAMNHSTWISNEETNAFWNAMPLSSMDFVWTTGVGNNNGYFNSDANASTYNGATARYDYLSGLTGKKILVDTSFGLSQAADSWTGIAASELNARIAEGVFAINITEPPSDYQSRLASLQPQLNAVCQ